MSTTITPTEQNIDINVTNDVIDINVTNEIVDVNATTQQIDINVAGAYPIPNPVLSVFGRTGVVVATEGDYTLTQLGDVTLSSPSNGQVLKYNGTAWVNGTDAGGITTLNTLTALSQTFATGTSGTDFNISSATATHTFNLPTASATNRGALSSADWTTFNNKQNALTNPITGTGTSGQIAYFNGTTSITSESNLFWDATNDRLGIGGTPGAFRLDVNGTSNFNGNITTSGFFLNNLLVQGLLPFTYLLRINGTVASPTAVVSGDILGQYRFAGQFSNTLGQYTTSARIDAFASENFSVNSLGTNLSFYNTTNGSNVVTERLRIFNTGNVLIQNGGTFTDAGFRLDVNGTARTQQLHSFLLGTLLDSTSASNFYSVNTGGSTYGGLALRNQTQDYTGYIQTGRSGNANGINFFHTTFAGATSGDGHQKFSSTAVVFGSLSKPQTLTIYKVGGSAGTAQYPLVLNNQTNTTNTGVGLIFQTGNETGGGPIDHANITAFKTNLGSGFVTSNLRFSTISDGANTLSEKMRISDASNLLIGTTTDLLARLQVSGSITASSAIARGGLINTTLVASANNDVLVGLDINPTFTNGAFTGVKNLSIRVGNSYGPYTSALGHGVELNTNVGISGTLDVGGDSSIIYLWRSGARANGSAIGCSWFSPSFNHLWFGTGPSTKQMILVQSTGNLLLNQNTDAGFRLDVNGTARVSGTSRVDGNLELFSTGVNQRSIIAYTQFGSNNIAIELILQTGANRILIQGGVTPLDYINIISNRTGASDSLVIFNSTTKGIALPNMTTTQRDAIRNFGNTTLTNGLTIYNNTTTTIDYYNGTNWQNIIAPNSNGNVLIGTTTDVASSILTINSTTKGVLFPRMTTTQKNAISSPATGLVVYDTTLNKLSVYTGSAWETVTSL